MYGHHSNYTILVLLVKTIALPDFADDKQLAGKEMGQANLVYLLPATYNSCNNFARTSKQIFLRPSTGITAQLAVMKRHVDRRIPFLALSTS